MSGKNPSGLSTPWPRLWPALLLAGLTLLLFWPATTYDYVRLDDDQYVANNPYVTTGLTLHNIRWAFKTVYEDWWLPLLWISFMADTALHGPVPGGYHLTNILLHAANAGLLFWALARLTGSRGIGFFAAALFAFHPLRVESVAWITARKDVLSGFFFMLSLLTYARQVERPSRWGIWVLTAWMLLGLLSKGILIILPFLLLLLDYWPLRRAGDPWGENAWAAWRPRLEEKIPLLALAAVFILINMGTHIGGRGDDSPVPWLTRMGLIAPNYWRYLALIVRPVRLVIFYPEHDVVHWPASTAAMAGLLALTGWAVLGRRRAPCLVIGWLWFLVALFPVIRGVRLGLAAYADRFTYLPSIGLTLALVWLADTLAGRSRPGRAGVILAGLLLLGACAWKTRDQLPLWADSYTMFHRLVEQEPDNDLANNSYGKALMERGRTTDALVYFAKAAALRPDGGFGVVNYAEALNQLERYDETIRWLEEALARGYPAVPEINVTLGLAHLNQGDAETALPYLRRTMEQRPGQIGWHVELVRALFEAGREAEAREEIARLRAQGFTALRGFDDLIPHYLYLWRNDNKVHAWRFFQNQIRNKPGDIALLNAAAWALATDAAPPAPPDTAVLLAQRALELQGGHDPVLLDTLAAALAAAGRFDEACAAAEKALAQASARRMPDLVLRIGPRLSAYRNHKPWHEH